MLADFPNNFNELFMLGQHSPSVARESNDLQGASCFSSSGRPGHEVGAAGPNDDEIEKVRAFGPRVLKIIDYV